MRLAFDRAPASAHLAVPVLSAAILAIVGTYVLVENTAEACILGRIPGCRDL